jgi:hypothetical protein
MSTTTRLLRQLNQALRIDQAFQENATFSKNSSILSSKTGKTPSYVFVTKKHRSTYCIRQTTPTQDAQERVQQILAKNSSFLRTKEHHENQNKHLQPPTVTLIADKSPTLPAQVSLLEMVINVQTTTPASGTKQRFQSQSTPLKVTPSNSAAAKLTKIATSTVPNIPNHCQLPLISVTTNLLTDPPLNKRPLSVDVQDSSRSIRRCQSDFPENPQTYPVLRGEAEKEVCQKRKYGHQHRTL